MVEWEKAEATLKQALDRIQLITHATLLTSGFHTHKRQWRKKRDVSHDRETDQREGGTDSDQVPNVT
jgi:hypothetical protein